MSDSHATADAHGEHHHHVVDAKVFGGVIAALFVLTFLTVFVAQFDFGPFNMLVAMAIAAVKASLVLAIFMHLRWDTAVNNIFFLSSFLFLSLLLIFTIADASTRGHANSENKLPAPLDPTPYVQGS